MTGETTYRAHLIDGESEIKVEVPEAHVDWLELAGAVGRLSYAPEAPWWCDENFEPDLYDAALEANGWTRVSEWDTHEYPAETTVAWTGFPQRSDTCTARLDWAQSGIDVEVPRAMRAALTGVYMHFSYVPDDHDWTDDEWDPGLYDAALKAHGWTRVSDWAAYQEATVVWSGPTR